MRVSVSVRSDKKLFPRMEQRKYMDYTKYRHSEMPLAFPYPVYSTRVSSSTIQPNHKVIDFFLRKVFSIYHVVIASLP
jgi:hypothetical protein